MYVITIGEKIDHEFEEEMEKYGEIWSEQW